MFKSLEITHVGRFKSVKPKGDTQFKRNTFIYGKNTFGKSTLTAIFRSLQENNPNYIVGRKTIGADKQTVKIIPELATPIGEYRYTTDESKWNNEFEDILVFDSTFVRENIYTQSQQIGQEQQKNIEAFMLGAKGYEFNVKISALADKIAENTRTQTSTTTEYNRNRHLLGGLTFEKFLILPEVAELEKKIRNVKKRFDKISNSELISAKLINLKSLLQEYSEFDIEPISKKISANSDLIAQHYERHVNSEEPRQSYSSFLQAGSKLRKRGKGERCVFCTQEIKGDSVKAFLETVDQIYNDSYRTLQRSLKEAEGLFSGENFTENILKITADLEQAGHVLEDDYSDLIPLLNTCAAAISNKKDDLGAEINPEHFLAVSEKIVVAIEVIDSELEKFKDPAQAKSELDVTYRELLATRERYSSWKDRCATYLKAKKESEILGNEKSTLWEAYLEYANSLSQTMLTDINAVLRECGCNFLVQKFNFKGNQRQDLLALVLGDKEILNDGKDHELTIKNCLSDSDKGILALAFFLATIKNDATTRVVVIDDPVSSLDADRKRLVLKQIKKVLKGANKQLILLTHERGFYHLLHAESDWESPTFLKIIFDTKEGSMLAACDPATEPEFMSEFYTWISNMKSASESEDIVYVKNAHADIRRVIEFILKAKYTLDIGSEENTVEKILTKLEKNAAYLKVSPRKQIQSLLTNISHHDQSNPGQYPSEQLGILDYKNDIRDAFQVIKSL